MSPLRFILSFCEANAHPLFPGTGPKRGRPSSRTDSKVNLAKWNHAVDDFAFRTTLRFISLTGLLRTSPLGAFPTKAQKYKRKLDPTHMIYAHYFPIPNF